MRPFGVGAVAILLAACSGVLVAQSISVGDERAVTHHLRGGEELRLTTSEIVEFGRGLFTANWTDQDGGGRPLTKGTGAPLLDRQRPLVGPRAMNRVSGPDANSCAGCHNYPNGVPGGSGDLTTVVFQLAQRFDFVTFDRKDRTRTGGSQDEGGRAATLQTVGNARATPDLFGAGYLEMLARQITADLQRIRDGLRPGHARPLTSKGLSFGVLARGRDGRWITTGVKGLPPQSLVTRSATVKPSLIVRPWLQSGSAVSLREVVNTSLNQHHGIQSTERFGVDADPDGDGVMNEATDGDVTALTTFVATLPVPGRVIPANPDVERAVAAGERAFERIGCTECHVPSLALDNHGWEYAEPGPYNPVGNLRRGGRTRLLRADLTDEQLPGPRLVPSSHEEPTVVRVPAYTDFKLHDITDPTDDTAKEPLDINQPAGSPKFMAGNRRFLTKRLWGVGNQPAHFHHGRFTSLKQAVLAHAGEALPQRRAFEQLGQSEQEGVLAFLTSLQLLPPGTNGRPLGRRP